MLLDILKEDLERIGVIFEDIDKDDLISSLALDDFGYFGFNIEESVSTEKFSFDLGNLINDNYKHIHSEGGGEGGAEYCESIFKYKDTYYKVNYSYYSHQGFDFDGICETLTVVSPKMKTITVYE